MKNRIMEMSADLEELGRDEGATGNTSAGTVNVNTARIEHVEDLPLPRQESNAATSDETSWGPSYREKGKWRQSRLDFPESM